MRGKRTSQEEYLTRVKEIHDGKGYDFSKTIYTGIKEKVTATCPIHGDFTIRADELLEGHGCQKCAKEEERKEAERSAVNRIKEKFPELDLSKFVYKGMMKKATLICHKIDRDGKEHGEFSITPHNVVHSSKFPCRKCFKEAVKWTNRDFIREARRRFPDKDLDFSKTDYKGYEETLTIICNEKDENGIPHGEFMVDPDKLFHDKTFSCPKCKEEVRKRKKITKKIADVKAKFADSITVVNAAYINGEIMMEISCDKHGTFTTSAKNLLRRACACPICRQSSMEREVEVILKRMGVIYVYQAGKFDVPCLLGRLSLDFYLPEHNAAIECQGIQHYEPTDFGGRGKEYAKEKLHYVQQSDQRKARLCEENGVRLFYIRYDENTEEALNQIMTEIQQAND